MESPEPIMQFFKFAHLPEKLQGVSKPFGELAQQVVDTLPRNPERSVALRKLLEAKDAAVRALIAVCLLLALPAFAQEAAEPVAQSESLLLKILSAAIALLSPLLLALIGKGVQYLHSKEKESKLLFVTANLAELAKAAVLEVETTLKPKLVAALADGILTDAEKAELKKAAMDLLKQRAPATVLAAAQGIFGPLLEQMLSSKVEGAVAQMKAQGIAAQVAPTLKSDPDATPPARPSSLSPSPA